MANNNKCSDINLGETLTALDGQGLKCLVEAALTWLRANQQIVNALNVFPVPDGDTGSNMVLTMMAAHNEVANSNERNAGKMAHAIAQGALMGARGNSGVILSQLWRGFARGLDNYETIDIPKVVHALAEARDTAYKGVVRPVEGTILTVAKDIATAAEIALPNSNNAIEFLEKVVAAADDSVQHTPELLPILKQAGVVDSGGKGLFFLFEGVLRFLKHESIATPVATLQTVSFENLENTMETIEPGQDYEVVIDFSPEKPLNLELYYQALSEMGTSIQLGEGDGMYRLHIHVPTENRYSPIDYTMKLGTVSKVYIENLIIQVAEKQAKEETLELAAVEPGQIAMIAVSPGKGISRIFASLGAAAIVEGGQTMNPSVEEILCAFEEFPTEKIIILPNNKNIILAAQAAATRSSKKVAVIPCSSVPQGLSAALCLMPDEDFDHIVECMNNAIKEVVTGEITIATRTVEINGIHVKEGEVIALHNGKLIEATHSMDEACLKLLEKANAADMERITFLYGRDITQDEVNSIVNKVRVAYPAHEVEIHEGGQPHYHFIIAIE